MQALIKDEASQPQQDSALDHKWFSIHMGEEWNSNWYYLSSPSLKWTSWCYWRNEVEFI